MAATAANAGTYAVNGAASSARTSNTGIGQLDAAYTARTNVNLGNTVQNGPRGIAHTADGTAWVVNSEAVAPIGGPAGAVQRFDTNLTEITGAGWTGVWGQREEPGLLFYRTGTGTGTGTTPDGSVLVNTETSDRGQDADPVSSVCITLSEDKTSAAFTIDCASGPAGNRNSEVRRGSDRLFHMREVEEEPGTPSPTWGWRTGRLSN